MNLSTLTFLMLKKSSFSKPQKKKIKFDDKVYETLV